MIKWKTSKMKKNKESILKIKWKGFQKTLTKFTNGTGVSIVLERVVYSAFKSLPFILLYLTSFLTISHLPLKNHDGQVYLIVMKYMLLYVL